VDEMVTGVRSDVAVKVFGDDLTELKRLAEQIAEIANKVQGARDIRVERLTGQQYLNITIDRQAIARYGLNASDIHDLIETAIAGKKATEIYQGERRFSASVRLPEVFRDNLEAIDAIMLTSPNGARVPLGDVTKITLDDGPAQISREMGKRRIVVGINVRDRDLGGFVAELQQTVEKQLQLPDGYYLQWGGQFQNMQRAMGHLKMIIPVTIAAIFFLLFMLFKSIRFALLIILVLPFASIGGIFSLFVMREYLSVPASVGFIALWGIAVLNGVVLVTYIRSLRESGMNRLEAIRQGCEQRFRPVMMTATVALLGLMPFLFANGPGSEVQKPLAIVVIGGLISSTLLTLIVLPILYDWFDSDEEQDEPVYRMN
jgi:cobalt-zinc-cadmium resistance protein CzcA